MCPEKSNSSEASALLTDCKCNPGTTGEDGSTCVFCVPGTYKETSGSTACSSCLANSSSVSGSVLATSCLWQFWDLYWVALTVQLA